MPKRPANPIPQAGVLPWRRSRRGALEVVLVTSRAGRHWTLPKGNVPSHLTPARAAMREAFEEAGLLGSVGELIGSYSYRKRNETYEVSVFPLDVTVALPLWPEAFVRERRWVQIHEAVELVRHESLRELLAAAADLRFA